MAQRDFSHTTRKAYSKCLFAMLACFALVCSLAVLSGCSSSESADALRDRMLSSESSYEHEENDGHVHMYNHNLKNDTYICSECGKEYEGDSDDLVEAGGANSGEPNQSKARRSEPAEPVYDNPLWPTNSPQLLSIPEENRWYNAPSHVGTYCTIAGPVVDVISAKDAPGGSIFVCIGSAYPDTDCVELLVWSEGDMSAFSKMITDVSTEPNSWLSVTGYLQLYEGYMQFNSADGCEFTWWTNMS